MENKYIYSINTIAYLRMNGIKEVAQETDEIGKKKYLFINNDNLNQLLKQYKNDIKLQKFILNLREIREEIKSK